ncbi:Druantia anti-phage system protein DruA [Acidithiobacillus thiooxidans]|uniref:Druantia anti-phage system protein DruA n=1 Tax=Acidithiobacillus thiooxidans TaxID=930 RepID=UPI001C06D589|nr:Druantia anti-phage system protein DruA [Acidithiobacillus thiooxidans]
MEPTKSLKQILAEIQVRTLERDEESRYQSLMAEHHYLGALPRIGETLWYVATWQDQWVAQISMSGAALKCGVRDRWIGWDFRSPQSPLWINAIQSIYLLYLIFYTRPTISVHANTRTQCPDYVQLVQL